MKTVGTNKYVCMEEGGREKGESSTQSSRVSVVPRGKLWKDESNTGKAGRTEERESGETTDETCVQRKREREKDEELGGKRNEEKKAEGSGEKGGKSRGNARNSRSARRYRGDCTTKGDSWHMRATRWGRDGER